MRLLRSLALFLSILACAPLAASALTLRVEWSATLVPSFLNPLPARTVSGDFGTFALPDGASFPIVLPLNAPITAISDLSPNFFDWQTYGFGPDAGGIGFLFESPTSGRIVEIAQPGMLLASVQAPGGTLSLTIDVSGSPPAPGIVAVSVDSHTGYALYWSGSLAYSFTAVPEPGTLTLLGVGLAAIAMRRR